MADLAVIGAQDRGGGPSDGTRLDRSAAWLHHRKRIGRLRAVLGFRCIGIRSWAVGAKLRSGRAAVSMPIVARPIPIVAIAVIARALGARAVVEGAVVAASIIAASLVQAAIVPRLFASETVVAAPVIALAFVTRAVVPGAIVPAAIVAKSGFPSSAFRGSGFPRSGFGGASVRAGVALAPLRGVRLALPGPQILLEVEIVAGSELIPADDLGERALRLNGSEETKIMFGVLQIVFGQNSVARRLGVAS